MLTCSLALKLWLNFWIILHCFLKKWKNRIDYLYKEKNSRLFGIQFQRIVSIDVGIPSGYVKWRFLFAQVVRNLDKHNNRQDH